MRLQSDRLSAFAFVLSLIVPAVGSASQSGVEALFDLSSPATSPFPSNRFTVFNFGNRTNVQVDLPRPDCGVFPSDCEDIAVINTLDGFNLQPRLSIPFSAPVDVSTVDSASVFLVRLGDTTGRLRRGFEKRKKIGIDQIVFDPQTNTLYAESDELLEQHTKYALIVTNGVRDTTGKPVQAGDFARFRRARNFARHDDRALERYRGDMVRALAVDSMPAHKVVAASVFTTQSATAVLEKIRRQIKRAAPAPADFVLGEGGERTVFALSQLGGIVFNRQTDTAPAFVPIPLALPALHIFPGSVGAVAFGSYRSPDYETPEKFIPPVATRLGRPEVQNVNEVVFVLFLPASPAPAGGWPVAVFGHSFGGDKTNAIVIAASLARQGIATVAIDVVGHGGGPLGTFVVSPTSGDPVTLPAGGRGIDQDGDGDIESTEGVSAAPPRIIISNRDGLRQTVIDIMQLVRVIETGGMDVDGDGASDLDRGRIYYAGISFGGMYGTIALGVEPRLRAGVPNMAGGPIIDIARLSPVFRPLATQVLAARVPPLLNGPLPPAPPLWGFEENLPLRDQPAVINAVAGAPAIQRWIDNTEWVSQSGNAVAYAPHVRRDPLDGNAPKRVIYQFAKGDRTVPNPTTTNIIRAGDLADVTTYFRNDLFIDRLIAAGQPAEVVNSLTDPHAFLARIAGVAAPVALAAQQQIATFFASDGTVVIDPDGGDTLFETPIVPPLPEELNFIF